MTKLQKVLTLLLVLLVAFGVFAAPAHADGESWKIVVTAAYGDNPSMPLKQMTYKLYKIATYDDAGTLRFEDDVRNLPITLPTKLGDYNDDAWRTFTTTLAAQASALTAAESLPTGDNGKLEFANSYPRGIYLLLGEKVNAEDGNVYVASPALFQVSAKHADAQGKVQVKAKPSPSATWVQVVKKWTNQVEHKGKTCDLKPYVQFPDSVTVKLFKDTDTVPLKTVTINKNSWTHTWDDLELGHDWRVEEEVPLGYTVTFERVGNKWTITNTPDLVWIDPPIRKIVTGTNPPTNATFTFRMDAIDGPVRPIPMPDESSTKSGVKTVTVTDPSEYEFEFGEFPLHAVGTYVYKISEVNTGEEGWTYTDNFYYKTVEVFYDQANNNRLAKTETLTLNDRPPKGQPIAGEVAEFTNEYKATPGPGPSPVSVTLDASKVLKGSPKTTADFEFRLVGKNGAPMPAGSQNSQKTVKLHGQGEASFGAMTFTAPGTYVYEVSEINKKLSGYTYDTNVYTVTVKVTEKTDGTLSVDISAVDGNKKSVKWDELVFINTYKEPAPQTGVLWWPVPVLLASGLLLTFLGVVRRRNEN